MNINDIDKLIIVGDIVLDSPMHIGTGDVTLRGADVVLRDKNGYPYIPGSSLAGVVLSHAQSLLDINNEMIRKSFSKLTGRHLKKEDKDKIDHMASVVKFRSSSMKMKEKLTNAPVHVRDGIRINEKTRSAADKAKFSLEAVPPGLRFDLWIEVELGRITKEEDKKWLLALIYAVLIRDFSDRQLGLLGKGSARGTGWFHFEDLYAAQVEADNFPSFLKNPNAMIWAHQQKANELENTFDALSDIIDEENISSAKCTLCQLTLEIIEGKDSDDWPLLIREAPELGWMKGENNQADQTFVKMPLWSLKENDWEWEPVPTIPGGSIRGVLHAFFKRLTKANKLSDKNVALTKALFPEPDPQDKDTEQGSRLRFRDAVYTGDHMKNTTLVERVALDEFTRSVVNKFNEEPLFSGKFVGKVMLEEQGEGEIDFLEQMINTWGSKEFGLIPIGAQSTPVHWKLEVINE